jgi:hypothetical protein
MIPLISYSSIFFSFFPPENNIRALNNIVVNTHTYTHTTKRYCPSTASLKRAKPGVNISMKRKGKLIPVHVVQASRKRRYNSTHS